MKEGGAAPLPAVSVKSASKVQEQQSTVAPPPPSMSETNGSSIINTNEGGNNQETEGLVPPYQTLLAQIS